VSAQDEPIRWTSSDPSIVSVTRSGLLRGHRAGQAVITASVGGLTAESRVTVTSNGKRLIVSPPVDTLAAINNSMQLTATLLDPQGKEIVGETGWMSTNPGVATVDQNGLLTSVGHGVTKIIAT